MLRFRSFSLFYINLLCDYCISSKIKYLKLYITPPSLSNHLSSFVITISPPSSLTSLLTSLSLCPSPSIYPPFPIIYLPLSSPSLLPLFLSLTYPLPLLLLTPLPYLLSSPISPSSSPPPSPLAPLLTHLPYLSPHPSPLDPHLIPPCSSPLSPISSPPPSPLSRGGWY